MERRKTQKLQNASTSSFETLGGGVFTGAASQSSIGSNKYPLHLIERHFFGATVVKLRRAGRGMVCHLRGAFERPPVLEVSRDAGHPERVVADARGLLLGCPGVTPQLILAFRCNSP